MNAVSKRNRLGGMRLERKMLKRHDLLTLNRNLCNGCGICIEVCLKDAITSTPAVTEDGNLIRLPIIDIDKEKCILCGICAEVCPLNALEAWVNGEKTAMFVKNEAFPFLVKSIIVSSELCKADCELKCEDVCPREAIRVTVERQDGQVTKIVDVQVDEDLCVYCKACEYSCPYHLFAVERSFEGAVRIEKVKCPDDCRVCIDVCPCNAIMLQGIEEQSIEVDSTLCIACKACQTACPEGAVHVTIEQVLHAPIQSSTWINLLQRFATSKVATKEMAIKSDEKRRIRVQTLPEKVGE